MDGMNINGLNFTGYVNNASQTNKVSNSVDIPINKGNYKLSGKTLEALANPQPGDFMYNLNKMSGLIDFSA